MSRQEVVHLGDEVTSANSEVQGPSLRDQGLNLKDQGLKNLNGGSRELTKKQTDFLNALFSPDCFGNVRKAMDKAGYPSSTPTSSVYRPLTNEIRQGSLDYLSSSSAEAALNLVNTMRNPARPGAKNRLDAAKDLLDRCGLSEKTAQESTSSAAIFILPPKDWDINIKK